jgi:hypothetical protein
MTRPVIIAAAISYVAAMSIPSTPAWAGSPYYREKARAPSRPDPDASGVPGIPNLQGCIKLCERDLNPCDPPVYKQADGRCNYMD